MINNELNSFLTAYTNLESFYRTCKNDIIPKNDKNFYNPFFACLDYLSSLSKNDVEYLKSFVDMHCKIHMFNVIKLHLISQNPELIKIPGMLKRF